MRKILTSKFARGISGIIISSVFLYFALRQINWPAFFESMQSIRYEFLALGVVFTVICLYFRAYRWKYILRPIKDLPANSLFSIVSIGFTANNLLPARLGEFVRAYSLGKIEKISKTSSLATIVCERVFDVFSLLLLLWLALLHHTEVKWLREGGKWILIANSALLLILFLLQANERVTSRLLERISSRLPEAISRKILGLSSSFLLGLKVMRSRKLLLIVALLSIPIWFTAILAVYFCLLALGISVPYFASLLIIVLVVMGSMIPSAPAYIGTTQYASILALSLFGIPKEQALAFSIVYHATQFFPVNILGLYYLWKHRIGFGEISHEESGTQADSSIKS